MDIARAGRPAPFNAFHGLGIHMPQMLWCYRKACVKQLVPGHDYAGSNHGNLSVQYAATDEGGSF